LDPLADAVAATIAANPEQIARWLAGEPGAWGFLAGRGVLAYRDRLGRSLTQAERRHAWEELWRALQAAQAKSS
jgi:hypothetical protein